MKEYYFIGGADADLWRLEKGLFDFIGPRRGDVVIFEITINTKRRREIDWPTPLSRATVDFGLCSYFDRRRHTRGEEKRRKEMTGDESQ